MSVITRTSIAGSPNADSSTRSTAVARPDALLDAVQAQRTVVPLITGRNVEAANLDLAASAPALPLVSDAVAEFLPWYSSVHRGAGFTSTVSTEVLEASRATIGRFVGARDDDHVVIVRNTTDALNLLAHALPERTTVIGFDFEHHANLLPWRRHRWVPLGIPTTINDAVERIEAALLGADPNSPRLVTVTGASNVTGEVLPIAEIAALAHAYGARIVVDAAQLAPHRAIDIASADIDYVAFSGHKLYAPFGAGALVGRADWLDAAEPYLDGGGAVRHVDFNAVRWATGPARHEAGTPNVVGAYAISAAIEAIETIGFDAIDDHERRLRLIAEEGLSNIDGVELHTAFDPRDDRIGTVTFNVDGIGAADVAGILSAEFGISVRDGAFCAHPFVRHLTRGYATRNGLHPSVTPSAVRASFGLTTTLDDVDRLIDAVERIASGNAGHGYRLVDGRPALADDHRPRPEFLVRLTARRSVADITVN